MRSTVGLDLAETPAYATPRGVISMLNVRRASSRSTDLCARRGPVRERWIPTVPGEGDLRSRSYPLVVTAFPEERSSRDLDDAATDVALGRTSK